MQKTAVYCTAPSMVVTFLTTTLINQIRNAVPQQLTTMYRAHPRTSRLADRRPFSLRDWAWNTQHMGMTMHFIDGNTSACAQFTTPRKGKRKQTHGPRKTSSKIVRRTLSTYLDNTQLLL